MLPRLALASIRVGPRNLTIPNIMSACIENTRLSLLPTRSTVAHAPEEKPASRSQMGVVGCAPHSRVQPPRPGHESARYVPRTPSTPVDPLSTPERAFRRTALPFSITCSLPLFLPSRASQTAWVLVWEGLLLCMPRTARVPRPAESSAPRQVALNASRETVRKHV